MGRCYQTPILFKSPINVARLFCFDILAFFCCSLPNKVRFLCLCQSLFIENIIYSLASIFIEQTSLMEIGRKIPRHYWCCCRFWKLLLCPRLLAPSLACLLTCPLAHPLEMLRQWEKIMRTFLSSLTSLSLSLWFVVLDVIAEDFCFVPYVLPV